MSWAVIKATGVGLLWVSSVWALPSQLLPVDEAAQDPTFLSFRANLQKVVQRRDLDGLMRCVDPDIRYSFGPCEPGVAGFRRYWQQTQSQTDLWLELKRVLAQGGAFAGRGKFEAPYFSSNWPKELSAFEYRAILGAEVRVHSKPGRGAPVIRTLHYRLVKLVEGDDGSPWLRIQIPGGGQAYASRADLGSAVGYRAFFIKKSNQWRMSLFIAGD